MTIEDINTEIQQLESQLTGDMHQDMDIKSKIHNLKMRRDGVKPIDQDIECVGCSS
jgi:hypothetical protein